MERLSDSLATDVLRRASELDAAGSAGISPTELRHAALSAGISEDAFDRALAEMQQRQVDGSEPARQPVRRAPSTRRFFGTGARVIAAVVIVVLLLPIAFLMRTQATRRATEDAPMVDEIIVVNCLTPTDAELLLRGLLPKGQSTMSWSDRAPRELRVHATPEQIRLMREKVAEAERAPTTMCTTRPDGA